MPLPDGQSIRISAPWYAENMQLFILLAPVSPVKIMVINEIYDINIQ